MIRATIGGRTYDDVAKLTATDGVNVAEVDLAETGVDVSDADGTAEDVRAGKVVYGSDGRIVGTLEVNNTPFTHIGTFDAVKEVVNDTTFSICISGILAAASDYKIPYISGSYNGVLILAILPTKHISNGETQLVYAHVSPALLTPTKGNTNNGFNIKIASGVINDNMLKTRNVSDTMGNGTNYSIDQDKLYLPNNVSVPCGTVEVYAVVINF